MRSLPSDAKLPGAVGLSVAALLVLTPVTTPPPGANPQQRNDVARISLRAADVDSLDPAIAYAVAASRSVPRSVCAREGFSPRSLDTSVSSEHARTWLFIG
jgi:hypothetical protein